MSNNLKPTKRKAFNFLRSYFDVLNELTDDKDKLDFLLSIVNKQFLDEDPKDLNFIVNLCYESQRHSIESSVKGWKRVNKENPTIDPATNPTIDPATNPKEEEEEVKEEGKGKSEPIDFDKFLNWFNNTKISKGLKSNVKSLTHYDKLNLTNLKRSYNNDDFNHALSCCINNQWAKENSQIIPSHFLKEDNFIKYLNSESKEPKEETLTERAERLNKERQLNGH